MTMTRKYLRRWEKSTFITLTAEQRRSILERFGTEPNTHEWTEQDILIQIQNFLGCGEFVKTAKEDCVYIHLPNGVEF